MWSARGHGRPIANGYSGTFPAGYQTLQRGFTAMPPIDEPQTLGAMGITHVVVDWNELAPEERGPAFHWFSARETEGALRVAFERDGVLIYELTPNGRAG